MERDTNFTGPGDETQFGHSSQYIIDHSRIGHAVARIPRRYKSQLRLPCPAVAPEQFDLPRESYSDDHPSAAYRPAARTGAAQPKLVSSIVRT
jgi:hypothetical protein